MPAAIVFAALTKDIVAFSYIMAAVQVLLTCMAILYFRLYGVATTAVTAIKVLFVNLAYYSVFLFACGTVAIL